MLNFNKEKLFEDALVESLMQNNWTGAKWLNNGNPVIENPTEDDLVNNWCDILEHNNRKSLNNLPLVEEEREMLRQQVERVGSPYEANIFINNDIEINRRNPDDKRNYGNSVHLRLYDKEHIGGGDSVYQIVRQPIFRRNDNRPLSHDRRGDIMLLINGLPLIHIELKRSGVPISEAYNQIQKYNSEGKFSNNFFTLIQMFVAMNPNDCVYFANCEASKFNTKFLFHWADSKNKLIKNWQDISKTLLSIPQAHKMVSHYTIADSADSSLKIMRSYQCHAVNKIHRQGEELWDGSDHVHGGYCYHCTGSGKTMTSFKAIERLSTISSIEKVIFLVDRSDLDDQSVLEFKNFAEDETDINGTRNTYSLYEKINRSGTKKIVCTIQKLNNLCTSDKDKYQDLCEKAKDMKCVFITDECHRSQFGDMCHNIRSVFKNSAFFGFTGTPIYDENKKRNLKTSDIFGDALSVYSIADGIRNGDVLAFDTEWVELIDKRVVILNMLQAKYGCDENEVYSEHMEEYNKLDEIDDADFERRYIKTKSNLYTTDQTKGLIVDDIIKNFPRISLGGKYHGIFAVSNIQDACKYFRLFREKAKNLKVTTIFSLNDKDTDKNEIMEMEILPHYNDTFDQHFTMADISSFEKNVALRLAHKKEMRNIPKEEQLDLVIVVDKLLTGYDSKFVNALYLDKELRNEALIQAFSRTNRVFKADKKHGIIRLYRNPNIMKENLDRALELYADADKDDMFVSKLFVNICKINDILKDVTKLFINENGSVDFTKLPEDRIKQQDFVNNFNKLEDTLHAARLQGLDFNQIEYQDEESDKKVKLELDEDLYDTLKARYKEIEKHPIDPDIIDYIIYNISYDISESRILIDKEYIEKNFADYLKAYEDKTDEEVMKRIKEELIKKFTILNQEEQEIARKIIEEIDKGLFIIKEDYKFFDYVNDYVNSESKKKCKLIAEILGIDFEELYEVKVEADNAGNPAISMNLEPHKKFKRKIKNDEVLDKFAKRNDIYIAYLEGKDSKVNEALDKYTVK